MPTRLIARSQARAAPESDLHGTVFTPLVHASSIPPFLDAPYPTKSLLNRTIFSFHYRTYRRSIKAVMRFYSSIAEPKESAFKLTHVLQACRRFFGLPVYLFVQ